MTLVLAFVLGALALQTCDGGGIFSAIDSRDVQLLSTYTNNSEIVNSRNAKGLTPLMEAARIGDVESVRMLLASGADEKSKASGFMVKDQVASYLRRTGEEKERVIDFFRRQGLDDMVRMVENEASSLGETPERVVAWKEILDILNRRELTKEKLCEAASQTNKVTTYAQLAISNNIDVVDACKMYIRMADAGKVAICQDRVKDEYVRQSQAVPILKGLSLALGSLKSTRYEVPPAVNKYDVDDNSQHSEAIYSAHRQQLLAHDRAVKQNQLLMLCIVMSQKVAQLYGPDFPSNPNFLCAVKEVASSPDEVESIVGKVRFFVDNGMGVFSSREF